MKTWILTLGLLLGLATPALAQIDIPNTFRPDSTAKSAEVNANFNAVGDAALNRTGGTITGNITVSPGVTIDGVDISVLAAGASGCACVAITGTTLTLSDASAGSIDTAGGINAGSGNVGIVDTSGRIPAISATYFASLSGADLTGLSATQLTSGTVPDARFPATLPALSGVNLTALNATNLASGSVPDARLSANVALLDALGTFTGGGLHLWSASTTSDNVIRVRNTNAGAAATGRIQVGNDSSASLINMVAHSSGYTTSGQNVADGGMLQAVGAGGLTLSASHASGALRFYSGGVLAGDFATTGLLELVQGIQINERSDTPANPASGAEANLYVKGDQLIIQFNDGGTVRYKFLDLTGTGVTWQQDTSAP